MTWLFDGYLSVTWSWSKFFVLTIWDTLPSFNQYLTVIVSYYLLLCLICLMMHLVSEKQTDFCCPDQDFGDIIILDWILSHE